MDEASQCVEPEALIPLKLGFTKLIMVGDPEQLPATVSSIEAKNKAFNVSLFSRIFKTFEHEENSPIQKLTVQYRMHSEIMTWPNQYFYGGILRQGDQNRNFPLVNYKVILFFAYVKFRVAQFEFTIFFCNCKYLKGRNKPNVIQKR